MNLSQLLQLCKWNSSYLSISCSIIFFCFHDSLFNPLLNFFIHFIISVLIHSSFVHQVENLLGYPGISWYQLTLTWVTISYLPNCSSEYFTRALYISFCYILIREVMQLLSYVLCADI